MVRERIKEELIGRIGEMEKEKREIEKDQEEERRKWEGEKSQMRS